MPDKCAKKTCPPHADGRTRACNPETGRCKLVKPKTAKTGVKPKGNGTQPMTQKEIVAHLESSGAYSELDNFRETHFNLLDGHGTGFNKVLVKWMIKHGATRVTRQLLKKLLPTPGKKVNLVVFNWGDEDYSSAYYEKAQNRSFDDLVATRLKNTDDAESIIEEAAELHHQNEAVPFAARTGVGEDLGALRDAPASDLVHLVEGRTPWSSDFYKLVWLKGKTEIGTYSSGRFNTWLTWLK